MNPTYIHHTISKTARLAMTKKITNQRIPRTLSVSGSWAALSACGSVPVCCMRFSSRVCFVFLGRLKVWKHGQAFQQPGEHRQPDSTDADWCQEIHPADVQAEFRLKA